MLEDQQCSHLENRDLNSPAVYSQDLENLVPSCDIIHYALAWSSPESLISALSSRRSSLRLRLTPPPATTYTCALYQQNQR